MTVSRGLRISVPLLARFLGLRALVREVDEELLGMLRCSLATVRGLDTEEGEGVIPRLPGTLLYMEADDPCGETSRTSCPLLICGLEAKETFGETPTDSGRLCAWETLVTV